MPVNEEKNENLFIFPPLLSFRRPCHFGGDLIILSTQSPQKEYFFIEAKEEECILVINPVSIQLYDNDDRRPVANPRYSLFFPLKHHLKNFRIVKAQKKHRFASHWLTLDPRQNYQVKIYNFDLKLKLSAQSIVYEITGKLRKIYEKSTLLITLLIAPIRIGRSCYDKNFQFKR